MWGTKKYREMIVNGYSQNQLFGKNSKYMWHSLKWKRQNYYSKFRINGKGYWEVSKR